MIILQLSLQTNSILYVSPGAFTVKKLNQIAIIDSQYRPSGAYI